MITILLEKILAALTSLLTGFTSDLATIKSKLEGINDLIIRNIISTDTDIIEFNTDLTENLCKCTISFEPLQSGSGIPSPDNVRAISGYDSINIAVLETHDPESYGIKEIEFDNTVYGGEVDVIGGSGTNTYSDKIDLGSLSWSLSANNHFFANAPNIITTDLPLGEVPPISCEIFKPSSVNDVYGKTSPNIITKGRTSHWGSTQIAVYAPDYANTDDFISAVTGKYVCYKVATPTPITTTPEAITTIEGDNKITTNTYIYTSEDVNTKGIEVCYFETVNNYFKNKEA